MPSIFFYLKFQTDIVKLNRLADLIFGNIVFWHPIRAEGRPNLTEYQMDLKMELLRPNNDISTSMVLCFNALGYGNYLSFNLIFHILY